MIWTIFLFFVYIWGLGTATTFFLKIDSFIEKTIVRLGAGLGAFVVLTSLMNLLHIPLHWWIILIISMIAPSFSVIKKPKFDSIKFKWSYVSPFIAVILCLATLFVYTKGAFLYPYLEDDDPWGHALSIKYIAEKKTLYEPTKTSYLFSYLDARPPGYETLMGILHQTNNSLQWTMKFFNALLISLGILFFYILSLKLLKREDMAAFATFILAMTPSFLSHFIWSHTLAIVLFIPAMTFVLYAIDDKRWIIPSAIMIASIILTQETQAVKFAIILLIIFGVISLAKKKIDWNIVASSVLGFLIGVLLWWVPMVFRYGGLRQVWDYGIQHNSTAVVAGSQIFHPSIKKFYWGDIDSVVRQRGIFTIKDFFMPQAQNMITVPIGVGFVIMILIILGVILILLKHKMWSERWDMPLLLVLMVYSFLGINGGVHWWSPIALYPFRFWLLFAMFGAMISVYGVWILFDFIKANFKENPLTIQLPLIIAIASIIMMSSGAVKYKINTSMWGPGGSWSSQTELQGYVWIKENLEPNTKIFDTNVEMFSIGMDMYSCYWCLDEKIHKESLLDNSPNGLHIYLIYKQYDYLLVGPKTFKKFGVNETIQFMTELIESHKFGLKLGNGDFYLLEVN